MKDTTNCTEKNKVAGHRFRVIIGFVFLALLGVLLAAAITAEGYSVTVTLLVLLKTSGLFFCILLIRGSLEEEYLERICAGSTKEGCRKVLKSPGARLLGKIPMADLGGFYFAGGVLSLVISLGAHTGALLRVLAWINLLALPYTFFSIYYQARVIKHWCRFCIRVQLLFWIEFLILRRYLFTGETITPGFTGDFSGFLLAVVWGFGLPALIWLAFRPVFLAAGGKKETTE
ncbi:MAG: vitamin K epoxide reductase family protein [bacterium]|nr:vitamin K epoxide reductase family protein [bacterium]